ncbi:YadA-like family protein, partial [Escherichia coli]|nr:YadA-like family protein [Escherichia coli]
MSKKFSKTILSSAVAGLMLVSSGALALDIPVKDSDYLIRINDSNNELASVIDTKTNKEVLGAINTTLGSVMTWNEQDAKKVEEFIKTLPPEQQQVGLQMAMQQILFPVDSPSLKLDKLNSGTLTKADIDAVVSLKTDVSKAISIETAPAYVAAVRSGGNSDAAVAAAKDGPSVLQEYNRIVTNIDQLNKDTTFAMDADGNITLDETAGTGERYGVKDVVAEVVEDTTVRVAEDGSLTTARNTQTTKRVNEAVVDLDKSVRTNSQDIATNRKAIQSNSRQLQEHNARLNDHQRQIRENHEEMKRAAAQSAALAGLFQPYSVGKFNATAALGGYSDKQAVAVGVGYRFNEQTAAKA